MERTFRNPVYDRNFPDPFVLKYRGEYWAYGTGEWRDGRWFGILRSRDLARWEEVGGALEPLAGSWPCQWAPEVSYHNGTFYLYYSIGDEATMHLRVATAPHPAGPFVDSGRRLSGETFAIDAHVFVDDDGSRHLFYATDYLEHSHVGTGTARVRLADPLTPAGAPTPVTRARYDWQVYDPRRAEKGGVRWHTIEGSFVLKRKGRYYQMFSGGNWQNPTYGVSYALADRLDTPEEWSQVADGEGVVPILRTVPGQVIGPGHNSVVRGPDNRELFCVYHRWSDDQSGRVMAIDRLDWAGERMLLLGPTTTPQPVRPPTWSDFFDAEVRGGLGPGWLCSGGSWAAGEGVARQASAEPAAATCAHAAAHFLAEVSLAGRALDARGAYGVALGDAARFLIQPGQGRVLAETRAADRLATHALPLPAGFAPAAFHLLRVELNAGRLSVCLDEAAARWEARLDHAGPLRLALITEGAAAEFAGFALTTGWADEFYPGEGAPEEWGWHAAGGDLLGAGGWRVAGGDLRAPARAAPLLKGPLPAAYELVVNARLDDPAAGGFGFYPAAREGDLGPLVALELSEAGWALIAGDGTTRHSFALPAGFDPSGFQQIRAVAQGGSVTLSWEGLELGSFAAPEGATHVGLLAGGPVAFDMVRVTGYDVPR
jgi:GH43 family beta-xylosidase